MKKFFKSVAVVVCVILGMEGMIPQGRVEAASVHLLEQTVSQTIPTADWDSVEWDSYDADVISHLKDNETAYYFSLDGKPLEGYKMYYIPSSSMSDENTFADFTEIKMLDEAYPGVYVFDMGMHYPYGAFYLYAEDAENIFDYAFSYYVDDINVASRTCGHKELFTVSFTSAEIDCQKLPNSYIVKKGDSISPLGGRDDIDKALYHVGGYSLTGWKDQNGNVGEYFENISNTTILSPVYQNEDEGQDVVTVHNLEEFTQVENNDTQELVVVDGTITITEAEEVNQVYHLQNDTIIIKEGSKLVIDGAKIRWDTGSSYASYPELTVQSGGVLELKNNAFLESAYLNVQKDANVNIENSKFSFVSLYNYGTIHLFASSEKAEDMEPCLYIDKQQSSNSWGVSSLFFNGKSGTIQIDAGNLRLDINRKTEYVNMNNGNMIVSKKGLLLLEGESSIYQNDRMKLCPFINNGTMKAVDITEKDYYNKSSIIVEYGRIENRGRIDILPGDMEKVPDSMNILLNTGGYFKIYGSELDNYGTIQSTTLQGVGISVEEMFMDPEQTSVETQATEEVMSSIDNFNSGVIAINSGCYDVGMSINEKCTLNNQGTLTLNNTNTSKQINNVAMSIAGNLNNEGSIINNGTIGFFASHQYASQMKNTGNAYTGNGNTAFYYDLYVNGDFNNGDSISIDDSIVETSSEAKDVFLPAGKTFLVKINRNGYKEYTETISSAATLDEYISKEYPGFSFDLGGSDGGNSGNNDSVVYVVSFDSNNGSQVENQNVTAGDKVVKPDNPVRKGYLFAGWYYKGEEYDFDSTVSEEIQLVAEWKKVTVSKPDIDSLSNTEKKKLTVKIKKRVSGAAGYQIGYSTNKTMKSQKSASITKGTVLSKTISNLTKGKKYYVRVRAYKKDSMGNKIYSKWSSKKVVNIKK